MGNRYISQETKDLIVSLYKSGKNTVEIQSETGITRGTVSKYLKSLGIEITRDRNRKPRKREIVADFFSEINTEEKAYILGLFYADGCNMPYKGTARIGLKESDEELLIKIRNLICPTQPIIKRDRKDDRFNGTPFCTLNLFSKKICEDLSRWGCVPAKTMKLTFPDFLDESLVRHFVRGYFDGDGCISYGINKRGYLQCGVTIVGTKDFCSELGQLITNRLNIKVYMYKRWKERNNNTRQLQFGTVKYIQSFINWIYDDSTIYLERKYQKYLEFNKLIQFKKEGNQNERLYRHYNFS